MAGFDYKLGSKIQGMDDLRRKFNALSNALRGQALMIAAKAGALPIRNEAVRLVRKRSGTTARSISIEETSSSATRAEVSIGTDYEVARYLEFGTRAHVILPQRKKALYWKGAAHPVRKVLHPGFSPMPFLRPAYDTQKTVAKAEIRASLRDAIHAALGGAV